MPDDYLSHSVAPKPLPPHSHKNTIVWMFLRSCKPGDGELGNLIRRLRDRKDMPRSFPHKTALINYLLKCRIDTATIGRNVMYLYSMYNRFHQQTKHVNDSTFVESVAPSIMVRSGVTRKQIAIAILDGMGMFSNAAQNLKEGGKWADSAYGAADAVIALFTSHTQGRNQPDEP